MPACTSRTSDGDAVTRIVTWLLGTVTAVTLLFGYHTSTSGPATTSETVVAAPATPATPAAPQGTGTGTASTTGTTVTGAVVQTRWGPVQVSITVADGKITAVDVPQYPDGNHKDEEINADALPTLKQETLSAQSADIDMVSGATVTSDGYVQSLQSALDQAGL
jgi:uncharacterized protein with FMN-binding domain